MSKFNLFLALRYLKPKRSFVSAITVISILGVTLGVAALMVVIAVMSGFEREVRSFLMGTEPHIQVHSVLPHDFEPEEGQEEMVDWRKVVEVSLDTPGVIAASPFVRSHAFVEVDGSPSAAYLAGVWLDDETRLAQLADRVETGEFILDDEHVMIGSEVSSRLGLYAGDKVVLYAPGNVQGLLGAVREMQAAGTEGETEGMRQKLDEISSAILPREATVAGVFTGGFQGEIEFSHLIFVPLYVCQELLEMGDRVDGVGLHTDEPDAAASMKASLEQGLPRGWMPETWMDRNGQFLATVQSERSMMYVVLFIIVLVAAFSTMNTMITVTVQKRREIGVITALGARTSQVVWIFLTQGMVVGFLGACSGVLLGWIVLLFRNDIRDIIATVFKVQIFNSNVYGVSEIPMRIQTHDIFIIWGGAFILCSLAAFPPAWIAARTHPAKALRNM